MKEAWDKHIQPLLDSYPADHFDFTRDPFLARYPKLTGKEKIEIEDTLVRCAFDSSDDETARKALAIAEALHTSKLAIGGMARLMRNELRMQLGALEMTRDITKDYVLALSVFGLTEAVPSIRALASSVGQWLVSGAAHEVQAPYRSLLRSCCLSLKRLGDDRGGEFVEILVGHDLRMNTLTTPELHALSPEKIIHSWDHLGPSAIRDIAGFFRGMQADQRSSALILLRAAAQGIDFHSDRHRQEVMDLIDGLASANDAQTTSPLDERMRSIGRKRSTQNALTGLVASIISFGFLVALLVLAGFSYLPQRATIYGVLTILASLTFGLFSAISALHEARTVRANRAAFVLAALTLAVCALVFVGLAWLAYMILS